MIIHINADWRIRSDPLQWILDHRPEREQALAAGSKEWRPIGYFKFMAEALLEAAERQVRHLPGIYGPETLETLQGALLSIREDIQRGLEGFRTEAEAYARRAGS